MSPPPAILRKGGGRAGRIRHQVTLESVDIGTAADIPLYSGATSPSSEPFGPKL
jgi:hypothetical protein